MKIFLLLFTLLGVGVATVYSVKEGCPFLHRIFKTSWRTTPHAVKTDTCPFAQRIYRATKPIVPAANPPTAPSGFNAPSDPMRYWLIDPLPALST